MTENKDNEKLRNLTELFHQRLENEANISKLIHVAKKYLLNMSNINNNINSVREAFANVDGSNVINSLISEIIEHLDKQN
jgi:hypothetical protein